MRYFNKNETGFDSLPNVILDLIFSRLTSEELISMMKTNKKMYKLGRSDRYWEKFFKGEIFEWTSEIKKENYYSQIAELIKKLPHLILYFTEKIGKCAKFDTLSGNIQDIQLSIKNKFQLSKNFPKGKVVNGKIVVIGGGKGSYCAAPVKKSFFFYIFFFSYFFFFFDR